MKRGEPLRSSDRKRPLLGKAIPADGRPKARRIVVLAPADTDPRVRARKPLLGKAIPIEGRSGASLASATSRRGLGAGKPPRQVRADATFREVVSQGPCAICGTTRRRREAHHLLAQEHIRTWVASLRMGDERAERNLLRRLLSDPRNGIAACPTCHQRVEGRSVPLARSKVPPTAFAFAAELGEWAVVRLEREYPDIPQRGAEAMTTTEDPPGPRMSREAPGRPAVSGTLASSAGRPEPR
jgi:hypothetical protein